MVLLFVLIPSIIITNINNIRKCESIFQSGAKLGIFTYRKIVKRLSTDHCILQATDVI